MLLASLIQCLQAYIVVFTVALLSATLWYYVCFFKPYAKFPAWRLEIRLPYWLLNRRKLDVVILKKLIEQARKHEAEGLFAQWFFSPIVFVYGEENIKSILPYATEKSPLIKIYLYLYGEGIFTSNGDRWKNLKKIHSPAFFPKALRGYVPYINGNARTLVALLSEKRGETVEEFSQVLDEYVMDLMHESCIGVKKRNTLGAGKLVAVMRKLSDFTLSRLFRPWLFFDSLLPLYPYARYLLKLKTEDLKTTVEVLEKVKESIQARDQSQSIDEELDGLSNRPKSMAENIIESFPSMSVDMLGSQMSEFAFAAFEAMSNLLMWTFYSIGIHPEIQERLYDEIATLEGEDVQFTDLQDLTYLDCVIKEVLRVYTPPFIARRVKEDVKCGNYVIPKNTDVTLFPFMLHRNPDIYPDPEKFDPDRFRDEESRIKPWNYIPFAEGPRTCIGKNFALLSMKIYLIHVLRNFKVMSPDRREDLTFKWSLTIGAEKDPRFKFIPRN